MPLAAFSGFCRAHVLSCTLHAPNNGDALRDVASNSRPCPWKRRVSARRGLAGEKATFLNTPYGPSILKMTSQPIFLLA